MMASDFLSRGIDYLGDLGAKLRDLRGSGPLRMNWSRTLMTLQRHNSCLSTLTNKRWSSTTMVISARARISERMSVPRKKMGFIQT